MNFIMQKILNKSFIATVLRYALVAVGTWLASSTGFDPGTWETISGAIMVIALSLMGGTESTKDKAVIEGKNVDVAKLPNTVKNQLEAAVSVKPSRSWIDILFGK